MEMTPAKLAFIRGQDEEGVRQAVPEVQARQIAAEKTIDLEPSKEQKPKASRRTGRGRSSQQLPDASEILDQVLVPKTIRLQRRTAQALERAYLEQKLMQAKPCTVQDIAEEALADWLEKAGYLD